MPFRAMWKTGDREAILQGRLLDARHEKNYLASACGFRAEGFPDSHRRAGLKQVKRPTIVLMDLRGQAFRGRQRRPRRPRAHSAIRSSASTNIRSAISRSMWNGIALAIVEGGQKRPSFNLAGDWGPWSQAPLEDEGALRVSISDLTTNLPPQYQLTPQILLDVRVGTVK